MKKDDIQGFSRKIAQCSRTKLVVVTYEIILNYLYSAKISLQLEEYDNYNFNMRKVSQFVNDLMLSLDFKYKISFELMSLYLFVNKCVAQDIASRKGDKIDNVINIINNLKSGFEEVAKEDTSGTIMENNSQVYAGLTYGKGTLNEIVLK